MKIRGSGPLLAIVMSMSLIAGSPGAPRREPADAAEIARASAEPSVSNTPDATDGRDATSSPAAGKAAEVTPLDLARWRGQVVLVDFWASWCAPCRESFPWMRRMLASYGNRGLVVVAVDLDEDVDAAARFMKDVPNDFVHVADPEGRIAEAYGLKVMPTSMLFDREGRPVYRHEGFVSGRTEEYERHIVELVDNRGPKTALTLGPTEPPRLGVRPWERGVLADPAMTLKRDPLEIEFDDHIYFSKEASSGGRGFGGGGCGCN